MKRLIIAGSAALSAFGTLVARARDHAADIRDIAEAGPRSIDALQELNCRAGSAEALAARIRSVLGPRNDDSRTVVDLIDALCEELDRREPSVICGCGA